MITSAAMLSLAFIYFEDVRRTPFLYRIKRVPTKGEGVLEDVWYPKQRVTTADLLGI